ncbi:hypothetical protein [Uliginosibacterium sp. TH139]|uniref:hypothetical protein n=1 Tax=Uliginosibacterium sp. TH139 TaxID=2067453 RepID=UPI000C7BE26F|nr:hypothetical protein [Uliginosibacterium sp. TH139]PLK47233.1 hypothetical protein C0V76_17515 [Uliginosibacterium sp. TH139]
MNQALDPRSLPAAASALEALASLRSDTRLYEYAIEGLSRVKAPIEFEAFCSEKHTQLLHAASRERFRFRFRFRLAPARGSIFTARTSQESPTFYMLDVAYLDQHRAGR